MIKLLTDGIGNSGRPEMVFVMMESVFVMMMVLALILEIVVDR